MVCKVDGNSQLDLDSRDWSMYSSILNMVGKILSVKKTEDLKQD